MRAHIDYETKMILFIVDSGAGNTEANKKVLYFAHSVWRNWKSHNRLTKQGICSFCDGLWSRFPSFTDEVTVILNADLSCQLDWWFLYIVKFPVGVRDGITFSLSVSLSSLQTLSCFFQLSTLAEDSCSASTSLALFSLKVCSSVSHFLALVLLPDRKDRKREREGRGESY